MLNNKKEQTILSKYMQDEAKERLRIKHSKKIDFGFDKEKGFLNIEQYNAWRKEVDKNAHISRLVKLVKSNRGFL